MAASPAGPVMSAVVRRALYVAALNRARVIRDLEHDDTPHPNPRLLGSLSALDNECLILLAEHERQPREPYDVDPLPGPEDHCWHTFGGGSGYNGPRSLCPDHGDHVMRAIPTVESLDALDGRTVIVGDLGLEWRVVAARVVGSGKPSPTLSRAASGLGEGDVGTLVGRGLVFLKPDSPEIAAVREAVERSGLELTEQQVRTLAANLADR